MSAQRVRFLGAMWADGTQMATALMSLTDDINRALDRIPKGKVGPLTFVATMCGPTQDGLVVAIQYTEDDK